VNALRAATDEELAGLVRSIGDADKSRIQSTFNSQRLLGHCKLGVIRLDYDYPAAPGDIDHPDSFPYDVLYRVIPGLTFGACQKNQISSDVEQDFRDGIDWLMSRGCCGITGDCGFMMWLQQMARRHASTDCPVFMSSLAQLPAITCGFAKHETIAIFTANSKTLGPMKDLIRDECAVEIDEKRFILVGCEDVPGFEAVALGTKVPYDAVEPGMVQKAKNVLAAHPTVTAFFLECTELPQFSDAIRHETGLPVWDAVTSCDSFMAGYQDNVRFGRPEFRKDPVVTREAYTYASNLTDAQKRRLVNKPDTGAAKPTKGLSLQTEVPKYKPTPSSKLANAVLGVIRLDYDYPVAPGDVDSPDSYAYDVIFRVIPGLTFSMCQQNTLTDDVKNELKDGIKFLESEGVSGITGDCGFMMWLQPFVRQHTRIPVFMSSLAQLPAITCAFGKDEQIAIFTANGKTLTPMKGLIKDECGVDVEDGKRFVIVGAQDVGGFEAVANGDHVDYQKTEPGFVALAKRTLQDNPRVKAFLFECTEMPQFSDAVRHETGFPVWDSITSCDMFMSGFQDNSRFGRPEFRKAVTNRKDGYTYGCNLTPAQKAKLINKCA
jgi:Asp/Glu/hydantoin racemase